MIVVSIAALVFALVAVLVAFSFVRWALRTIARKDAKIDELRATSMERYARLVGQQLEATPRERAAENELAVHQARREFDMARVLADPEQEMEYGSPSDARFRERTIFEQLRDRTGIALPEEILGDGYQGAEFLDISVDAAR